MAMTSAIAAWMSMWGYVGSAPPSGSRYFILEHCLALFSALSTPPTPLGCRDQASIGPHKVVHSGLRLTMDSSQSRHALAGSHCPTSEQALFASPSPRIVTMQADQWWCKQIGGGDVVGGAPIEVQERGAYSID